MLTVSAELQAKIELAMQTFFNDANPVMQVHISQAGKLVADTEFFDIKTAFAGVDMGASDIAFERSGPDDDLEAVWMVFIDPDGEAWLANYYLPTDEYSEWSTYYDLGPAVDVAIEFDGRWQLNQRRHQYEFVPGAGDPPWMFRVTAAGALIAYNFRGPEIELAASGVTKCSAVRGWRSTIVLDYDQGLIVAYIRSGTAYYRAYADQGDSTMLWEPEQPISGIPTGASNVNAFRTEDQRVGFIAEVAGNIHWSFTMRGGNAVQSINSLDVGSRVSFGGDIWLVADKYHAGYPHGAVTLIRERVITYRAFDAKETSNPEYYAKNYGSNRYVESNIAQWLNSAGAEGAWFTPSHTYDAAPLYASDAGFMARFTANERAAIVETSISAGADTFTTKVFIPSANELGHTLSNSAGTRLRLFSDHASRQAYRDYYNDLSGYWVRDPKINGQNGLASEVRSDQVQPSGLDVWDTFPYYNVELKGARPVLNLQSDVWVTIDRDRSGCHIVLINRAPGT